MHFKKEILIKPRQSICTAISIFGNNAETGHFSRSKIGPDMKEKKEIGNEKKKLRLSNMAFYCTFLELPATGTMEAQ